MTHCVRYCTTNRATLGVSIFIEHFKTEEKTLEFLNHPPKGAHGFDYWKEEDLNNTEEEDDEEAPCSSYHVSSTIK